MSVLERDVVMLDDKTCTKTSVDSARMQIFTTKSRSIDAIPPTQAALLYIENSQSMIRVAVMWLPERMCEAIQVC